ncbi:unnamed protein product [Owenia fusiformis]|uniref:Uncharacterized protein n=1 Tax=Owenia fusiformis TaxID=6347 RepID=A0A8S4NJF5_OWEFU|nr:unnamed protein product [Owenia fusiformis]
MDLVRVFVDYFLQFTCSWDRTQPAHRIGKGTAFAKLQKNHTSLVCLSAFEDQIKFQNFASQFILSMYCVTGKKTSAAMTLDDLCFVLASTTDKQHQVFHQQEMHSSNMYRCARFNFRFGFPVIFVGPSWKWMENSQWEMMPVMITKDPAPIELSDVTHLYCKDANCNVAQKCPCLAAGLTCIPICACHDQGYCSNIQAIVNDPDEDDSSVDVL